VRRPDRTFATPDHYVSTLSHDLASINEPHRRGVVEDLEANAKAAGLTLFGSPTGGRASCTWSGQSRR